MTMPIGVTLSLDGVQKFQADGRVAAATVDNIGVSAKQTAAALRGVPAQFTDIITSLQGGQAPLTVFLQQGGQLKDMFGGAGAAAKALGGYVVGLVNPFTVAAAAGVALAVAYKQGSAEADAYTKSIALTGNAAGVTAAQLQGMAARVSDVVGTQAKAADVLAQLVGTGNVAKAALEQQAATAIRLERNVGIAVKDTVKEFAELGKDPVEAAKKLNERYNYLTAAVYEQIKALKDQGNVQEAVALSQATYEKAMSTVADTLEGKLGYLERAWRGVGDGAKWAWDQMLNVGRPRTSEDSMALVRSQLARQQQELADKRAINPNADTGGMERGIEVLKQRLGVMESDERMLRRGASAQAARAQAEKDAITATEALQKIQAKGLTQQEQMNKALDDYRANIAATRLTNPNSATLTPEAMARGERAIREQYKPAGSGSASGGENEVAALRAQANEAERYLEQLRARGVEVEKLTVGEQRAAKIREELKTSITGTARAQKELALVEADRLAAAERATVTEKTRIKTIEESEAAYRKFLDAIVKSGDAYGTQADQQEAANASFGRSKTAIEEAALAQQKLYLANEKAAGPWDPARISAMEYAIKQQERYVEALRGGDGKALNARADEMLRAAQELSALYTNEAQLVGLSNLERTKTVALRQVELKYAKELADLEKSSASEEAKQNARDTINRAKRIEGEAVVAKAIQDDWTRTTDEINRSLTDALLRGFESGKDFAKNLRDTIANMFKTLVLRPIISAIVSPVAGLVTGALGLAGGASAASGGGSALSTIGGIGSAISAGTSAFGIGASYGLQSLIANGLGTTLSAGTSMIGAGSIASGLGTIAGALGPIALGIGALVAISKATKGETRTGGQFGVSFDGTVTNQRRDQVYTYQGQQFDRDFSNGQRNALIAGQAYRLEGDPVQNEQAIRDAVAGTAKGIDAFLEALGSSARLTGFSAGFETSSKDRGGNFAGGTFNNGTTFGESGKGDNYAGTLYEKFSTNSPDFKTALENFTLDLKQSTIQALQSVTDIPQAVQKMLKGVDAEALSEEAANALLESINAQIVGVQNLTSAFEAMGLDKLAKMGFDAAAGLAAASGGFDKLQGNLNTYYDNFTTEDQKRANLQKQLDKQFAALGIDVPKNRDEFRRLVEGTLEQVDVQEKARASLSKQISNAIASAGKDGFTLSDAGGRSVISGIDPALLGNAAADPAVAGKLNGFLSGLSDLADKGLDPAAFDKGLADLVNLNSEVLGMGKDASRTAAVLLGLSGTFAQLNESAEETNAALEAQAKAQKDAAYGLFRRALDRDREAIGMQVDVLKTSIDAGRALVDMLRSTSRSLLGTVESTSQMLAAQGMVYIENALAGVRSGGRLQDYTGLSDAVSAAVEGVTSGVYRNDTERGYDALVLAGQLNALGDTEDMALGVEERQLKVLNDELERLKSLEKHAADLVEGNAALTETVDTYFQRLMGILDPGKTDVVIGNTKPLQVGGGSSGGAGFGPGFGSGTSTPAKIDATTGKRTFSDGSVDYLTEGELDLYRRGILGKVTYFDVGTNYVPKDMLAVVHKGEQIVPAAFNPFANPGAGLGNTERLESLVASLIDKVSSLEAAATATAASSEATAGVLYRVTNNGNGMVVVDAPL